MRTHAIAIAALTALAGSASGQVFEWDNNAGGLWNAPANWDPMMVPNSGSDTASIALAGTYDVFLNIPLTVGTLSLTNPNASVTVEIADSLSIDSGIVNDGELIINNSGGAATTTLFLRALSTPITGTGSIRLNGFSSRATLTTTTNATATNGPSHLIHGYGRITADLVNNGTIDADVPGQILTVTSEPVTNNAVMRGSAGGILEIDSITLTQGPAGQLIADGGTVRMGDTTVVGGTLDSVSGGTLLIDFPCAFDAVTLDGDLTIEIGDSLVATSSLVNNATLLVNNSAAGANTTLTLDGGIPLSGSGDVLLNGFSTRARLTTANGTATIQSPQLVHGYGYIDGDYINNSTIDADTNAQEIRVVNSTVENNNLMRASSGGILNIDNTTVNNASGAIIADAGTVRYGSATINGGTLDTINGGTSIVDVSSAFNAVTLNGDLVIEIGDTLTVTAGLTNNATVLVNNSAGGANTNLLYADSSDLQGSGDILLNGFSTRAALRTDAGQTLTHRAPHLIHGYGYIAATIDNRSLISADIPAQTIFISSSTIDNTGTLEATAGGILEIENSTINNTGALVLADNGIVRIENAVINGGTIDTVNGGTTIVGLSSDFDGVTVDGPLTIEIGDSIRVTNNLTNNGVLTVNNSAGGAVSAIQFNDDSALLGTGTAVLNGFSTRAQLSGLDGITATQGIDHTIEGEGLLSVTLLNNGTIAPGFPGASPIRTMLASEDISNTASADYRVEVQGNNNSDLIDSSAAYHADGTLTVELINGFDPTDYWGTPIVQADGGITGRYKTLVAPIPDDGRLEIRVRYLPNEIRVGAVCKADMDFNGMLNFFDISTFIALFNAQDPDADIAAPFGTWNFFDIATYIGQYNAGCP